MKKIIDRQIHSTEIKLRLLLTNKCNFNCSFCLNDFQKEGNSFLYEDRALQAISYYVLYFTGKVPLQVYFSGGEPTLHSCLPRFLELSKRLKCRTTLITNGSLNDIIRKINGYIDCLHISAYKEDKNLGKLVRDLNGDLQLVYNGYHYTKDLVEYYSNFKRPIKVFQNYFDKDNTSYLSFANQIVNDYPNNEFSFRYTGVQENRGEGCKGCDKRCVTLKAAWMFPDGGITACPQLHKFQKMYPISPFDWLDTYKKIYEFHKLREIENENF